MSGVSNFLEKRTSTPPGGIPHNRAAAINLKVSSNPRRGISPAPTIQAPPSAASNPAYPSNPSNPRNLFPNHQYPSARTPEPSHERNIFNTTAGSSFEDTKSELQGEYQDFEQDDHSNAQNGAAADYSDGVHRAIPTFSRSNDTLHLSEEVLHPRLHHKQSQPQLKYEHLEAPKPQYPPGISGRFQHPGSLPNLHGRPSSDGHIPHADDAGIYKKRGRSSNGRFETQVQPIPRQLRHAQGQIWEQSLESDESNGDESPRMSVDGRGQSIEGGGGVWRQAQIESLAPQRQRPYIPSPEYDDERLKTMSFAKLKHQSWDIHPDNRLHHLPEKLQGREEATVGEKLDLLVKEDESTYGGIFEQMPTAEWDLTGDLLIERMSDLMQKIRAARAKKRKVVEGFEAVYEARENVVRGKISKYDDKLVDMKNTGEVVLRGKRT